MKTEILAKIQTQKMGKSVHFYECTDSTNVQAKLMAEAGAGHGTLFVANKQTAGRGRRGRQWNSPAGGNLYFSLLLKPEFAPDKASMLTLVMAMAVAEGIEKVLQRLLPGSGDEDRFHNNGNVMQAEVGIKWPNDLCINDRKICGILTEMSVVQNRISHVVIGVGINVARQEFAPELVDKATGIEAECGQEISGSDLLAEIMLAFEREYEVFLAAGDLSGLRERYNARLVNCDREVRVLDPKGEFGGIARGINNAGELLVEREDGTITAVYAGEVSVRGIYGYV